MRLEAGHEVALIAGTSHHLIWPWPTTTTTVAEHPRLTMDPANVPLPWSEDYIAREAINVAHTTELDKPVPPQAATVMLLVDGLEDQHHFLGVKGLRLPLLRLEVVSHAKDRLVHQPLPT